MALPQTPQKQLSAERTPAPAVDQILRGLGEAQQLLDQLRQPHRVDQLYAASILLSRCFARGGKLIVAGNGGSLCDAMHMAEELTGYFRCRRPALPALALADPGHMSCVANDAGFEHVFSRGIEAHGKSGDIFAGLTTSGTSQNIVRAFQTAKARDMKTIAFLGKGGGALSGEADVEIALDGFHESDRIQEAHMMAIHLIIELCESHLFTPKSDAMLL